MLCLADWVLIEDLGFLGGVGTDPNSMVPMLLVFVSGYVALTRLPATAAEPISVRIDPSGIFHELVGPLHREAGLRPSQ